MSNLSVNTITDASGGSTASINGLTPQASNMQPFNRIINGAMTVDQRNAGAATANTINGYTLDRWSVAQSTTGKLIVQQNAGSITPPVGFSQYLGITSQSAYSVLSGDYYWLHQTIEGYNMADFNWGTANGVSVILSFWVRSSLAGSFGGSFRNAYGSQQITYSYTINSANTWEYKTITIPAPTNGSSWNSTNEHGVQIVLGLGFGSTYGSGTAGSWSSNTSYVPSGSVSVVGTSGATFYITGVQLEAGSTASPFAHENYADTLRKCRRYLPAYNGLNTFGACTTYTTNTGWCPILFDTPTRVAPTSISISSAAHFNVVNAGAPSAITIQSVGLGTNGAILVPTVAGISGTNSFYSTSALAQILFNGCEL